MRKVVVLSGLSGSGKSTYAKKLWNDLEPGTYCKVVSADDYFMVNGEYKFDPMKLGDAHGACFREFLLSLEDVGYNLIIVDNTCLSVAEIAPYMLGAQAFGWESEVVTLQCTKGRALGRNVHNVSERAIEGQLTALASRQLPPWWKHTEVSANELV